MSTISIYSQFWRYTLPTVAAMLVNGLYQVIDGIFIGHYVGGEGLAAINMAWPVIGFLVGIGMMVGVGTGILVSIRQGENNIPDARRVLTTGLSLLLILAPLLALALNRWADLFMQWQGAEGRVADLALEYLQIQVFSCLFTLGGVALPFLLRNDNSPNLATLLMVVGAVLNFVLDYLFIAWLNWELQGAAIATGLAQFVVTLIGVAYFFSSRAELRLSLHNWQVDVRRFPQILSLGASSFFMYIYGSVMVALHNAMLIQYGTPILVGAYAVIGYIIMLYYLLVEGIANGMQPLASYNHGAQRHDNIVKLLKVAMGSAIFSGVLFVLIMNIWPVQIVSVFNNSDAELIDGAVAGIRWHMFALFLDGLMVVAAAYYQSIGQSKKAMLITVSNMVVQFPFLMILPIFFDVIGVWLAYPVSNIVIAAMVLMMLWRDFRNPISAPIAINPEIEAC